MSADTPNRRSSDASIEERLTLLEAEMRHSDLRHARVEATLEKLSTALENRMESDELLVREMTSTIIRATASISHLTEVVADLKQAVADNASEVIKINNKLFKFDGARGTIISLVVGAGAVITFLWSVFAFVFDKFPGK